MANSTYVSLKDEISLELFEIAPYQENRPGMKSPSHQVTKLVCGLCNIVRPHSDMTQNTMDLKKNLTHTTQDSRLVPYNIHDMSHCQSVSHQVNVSHSQLHQNDILYNESSFNETTKNKRSLFLTLLLLGMHVKVPTTRVSH